MSGMTTTENHPHKPQQITLQDRLATAAMALWVGFGAVLLMTALILLTETVLGLR